MDAYSKNRNYDTFKFSSLLFFLNLRMFRFSFRETLKLMYVDVDGC